MLIPATDVLTTETTLAVTTSDQVAIVANPERNGLNLSNDAAGATVYLRLGSNVATATAFDIALAAGANWPGMIGPVVWRGAVHVIGAAASHLGITET